jgi:hypothetical protein
MAAVAKGDWRMDNEFRGADERRAAIVALTQQETGIDEAMIETLIRAFYARVRQDPLLAPIFEQRISDWEPHLNNMFAFWSSLTLQTGRYHGQPMAKHISLAVEPITSIDGLRYSKKPRASFVRPPPQSDSSSGLGASRRALSLESRARTEFCCKKGSAIGGSRDAGFLTGSPPLRQRATRLSSRSQAWPRAC